MITPMNGFFSRTSLGQLTLQVDLRLHILGVDLINSSYGEL